MSKRNFKNSKHGKNNNSTSKNNKFLKVFLSLAFITFFIILLIYTTLQLNTLNSKSTVKINNNEHIIETKTVENAEYLEITGLDIKTQDGFSHITTNIKNTSPEVIENFTLTIYIQDDAGNTVSELSNPISELSPNESVQSYGIVELDLSKSYTYIVIKN